MVHCREWINTAALQVGGFDDFLRFLLAILKLLK
jgi:hypothetical protein